jgi:uncharacterized protein YuzE
MRFRYQADIDVLYVELRSNNRKGAAVRNQELAPGVVVDFDQKGRVLGLELLGASRHVPRKQLARHAGTPSRANRGGPQPDGSYILDDTMEFLPKDSRRGKSRRVSGE